MFIGTIWSILFRYKFKATKFGKLPKYPILPKLFWPTLSSVIPRDKHLRLVKTERSIAFYNVDPSEIIDKYLSSNLQSILLVSFYCSKPVLSLSGSYASLPFSMSRQGVLAQSSKKESSKTCTALLLVSLQCVSKFFFNPQTRKSMFLLQKGHLAMSLEENPSTQTQQELWSFSQIIIGTLSLVLKQMLQI